MSNLAEPRRCARGPRCLGYDPDKEQSAKLHRYNKKKFCKQCQERHAGGYRTSSNDRWVATVIEAIERVFAQRPTPQRPGKATLWDLFGLDSHNSGWKKYSDRGAALMRLDAKTLNKLRDWLEAHEERAVEHHKHTPNQYADLYRTVSLIADMKSLPSDKPLVPKKQGIHLPSDAVTHTSRGYVVNLNLLNSIIPFDAVAHYTTSGRAENLKTPILAALLAETLRQQQRHISDREIENTIEETLEVPRTTQKKWFKRMEEVGMTWRGFTPDQLEYVVLGEKRGRRFKED
jgi:hypothetical protein